MKSTNVGDSAGIRIGSKLEQAGRQVLQDNARTIQRALKEAGRALPPGIWIGLIQWALDPKQRETTRALTHVSK
jgi:hypothetical protein